MAASRSMTCTFGNRSNRFTQRNTSLSVMASRSPCTSWTTAPPWRSMAGISTMLAGPLQSHRDAVMLQVLLERPDAGFGVVKDRCGERGIGRASREDVDEVVRGAGAARR